MQQEVNKRIPVSLLIHRNNILLKEMYSSEKKGGKEGEGFRRLYQGGVWEEKRKNGRSLWFLLQDIGISRGLRCLLNLTVFVSQWYQT